MSVKYTRVLLTNLLLKVHIWNYPLFKCSRGQSRTQLFHYSEFLPGVMSVPGIQVPITACCCDELNPDLPRDEHAPHALCLVLEGEHVIDMLWDQNILFQAPCLDCTVLSFVAIVPGNITSFGSFSNSHFFNKFQVTKLFLTIFSKFCDAYWIFLCF